MREPIWLYQPVGEPVLVPAVEDVTVEKWYQQLEVPQAPARRFEHQDEGHVEPFVAPVSSWGGQLEVPQKPPRLVDHQDEGLLYQPFPSLETWYNQLELPFEPPRLVEHQEAAFLELELFVEEPDSWYQPLSLPEEPPRLVDHQDLGFVPPRIPAPALDLWYRDLELPQEPSRRFEHQDEGLADELIVAPVADLSTWYTELELPLLPGVRFEHQEAGFLERSSVPELDLWYQDLELPLSPPRLFHHQGAGFLERSNVPELSLWYEDLALPLEPLRLFHHEASGFLERSNVPELDLWYTPLEVPTGAPAPPEVPDVGLLEVLEAEVVFDWYKELELPSVRRPFETPPLELLEDFEAPAVPELGWYQELVLPQTPIARTRLVDHQPIGILESFLAMATQRVPILGFGTVPDTSGEVFFESYAIKASNDVWDRNVCIFNNSSTRDGLHGGFQVPQNYLNNAAVVIEWTATVTSGAVEWDLDYRAVGGDDAESLDQSGNQESVNAADTAPSAAHEKMTLVIPLTDANFSPGDEVQFTLFRDGTDAGDTMASEAILFGLYFQFNGT